MRRYLSNFFRTVRRWLLAAVVFSVVLVLCLRWVPPPSSAVMIEDRCMRLLQRDKPRPVRYRWVAWKDVSANLPIALVAGEDQKFPFHRGFDIESIRKAIEAGLKGRRLRGASTISQQVAKNLFLWSGRSFLRKGLEAYFTVLLELFWPKKRILEVYMNIAEFGDGIYGAQEASTLLLGKPPSRLTRDDAALLAAVLPNPVELKVNRPSHYVYERRQWIREQVVRLGGPGYLKDME